MSQGSSSNTGSSAGTTTSISSPEGDQNQGEGNRDAARRYNEAGKAFAESGRVERAAHDANPKNEQEARELRQAEEAGRSHAKEEDPAVRGANEIHDREKGQGLDRDGRDAGDLRNGRT